MGVLGGDARVTSCDWNDVLVIPVSGRVSTMSTELIPKSKSRLCWSAACFLTACLVHRAVKTKKAILNNAETPQRINHTTNMVSVGSLTTGRRRGRCSSAFVNPTRAIADKGIDTAVTTTHIASKRQNTRGRRSMGSTLILAT